jgi:hypothetical protein
MLSCRARAASAETLSGLGVHTALALLGRAAGGSNRALVLEDAMPDSACTRGAEEDGSMGMDRDDAIGTDAVDGDAASLCGGLDIGGCVNAPGSVSASVSDLGSTSGKGEEGSRVRSGVLRNSSRG